MLPELSEALTQRVYAWERRGRGWHAFDYPLELEPEFQPFIGHYAVLPKVPDYGKQHTLFSRVASLFSKKEAAPTTIEPTWIDFPLVAAYEYEAEHNIIVYSIVLPKE